MVGLGHRIGRTLRVPGRGLRRMIVLLVVLVTAGATGSAVALSTPSVLAALHTAPVVDAQPALPRLALGPLAASAPMPSGEIQPSGEEPVRSSTKVASQCAAGRPPGAVIESR